MAQLGTDKPLMSRSQVARSIVDGRLLLVHRGRVLDVSNWAKHHPGGHLSLLHFVGRDATCEIEAYHSSPTLKLMNGMVVGRIEQPWRPLTPPIAIGFVQHANGKPNNWREEGPIILRDEVLSGFIPDLAIVKDKAEKESTQQLPTPPPTAPLTPELKAHSRLSSSTSISSQGVMTPPESPSFALPPTQSDILSDIPIHHLTPAHLEPPRSSIDVLQEAERVDAYFALKQKLESAGFFDRSDLLRGYGPDLVRYTLLGGFAFTLFFFTSGWLGQMASAALLGAFWHQLTFLAHDAGHTGVTGNYKQDRVIGTIVADFIGGLSLGWWCDNHNIHHLVTNHPEHDPDIQHIPFFAISTKFFGNMWSTYYKRIMPFDKFSRTMVGLQHRIYYVVLSLARFNLYANSYGYLLGPKPKHDTMWKAEMTGVAFFWLYFGAMLRSMPSKKMAFAYLLVSHICTSPVHVQIVLSHFACSTEDLGPVESFPSRQIRTTMDVECSPSIEFVHGGLHLQVTHHLFPRMPRHNLRKASLLVKDFCREQDMIYREHTFVQGNRYVLAILRDVANQLEFMKQVADAEVVEKLQ